MGSRDPKRALTVRPPAGDYDVGYGKPPTHSRFSPGRSGNPSGRPRGSRNKQAQAALNDERLKTIVLEEAYRSISINDAGGQISIPMVQAVVRSLAVNAAKGNQRAQRLFTQLVTATERDNKRLHDEWLNTAIEYKVEWERELLRRQQMGITNAPPPLPHPDHVVVDVSTGSVRITGPMTKEDKARWDALRQRKADCQTEILELEKILQDNPQYPHRAQVQKDIEHEKKLYAMIAKYISD